MGSWNRKRPLMWKGENRYEGPPYAVAVVCKKAAVGHMPWKILWICAHFMKWKGKIRCQVVGRWHYFVDRPQGSLEILCLITFEDLDKDVLNVRRLLNYYSLLNNFCVVNFCRFRLSTKSFNNEKFLIYMYGTIQLRWEHLRTRFCTQNENYFAYNIVPILGSTLVLPM